ncbi:MAG: iron ABC transporter permease [Bacteroidota bacterium]
MDNRQRQGIGLLVLLLLAGVSMLLGLHTGSYDFSSKEIFQAIIDPAFKDRMIIVDLRLPRVLLALLSGGILALGGFYMQVLIKNPLADPYIMGLTAGAGFGVNLLILGIIPLAGMTIFTYPIAAGLGGLGSLALLALLGFRGFYQDNAKLLIAGVAVASIFTALTGILIYTWADSDQIRNLVFWSFGSFGKANWEAVQVCVLLLLVAILFGLRYSRSLDVLYLGDLQAQTLGMSVVRMKWMILILTSLVVGGSVAFTGPIGFVGMMIPHVCRGLFGGSHRPNILLGSLLGGSYLCLCDVLTRWMLPPAGLPIGIITAVLGVPFFLYLLYSPRSHL